MGPPFIVAIFNGAGGTACIIQDDGKVIHPPMEKAPVDQDKWDVDLTPKAPKWTDGMR